jgi:uncharacterized protein YoxC
MDTYALILLICAVVACLAFTFLVIFLVLTLVSLTKTLKRVNYLLMDVEEKLFLLHPLFEVVGKIGLFAESCVDFFSDDEEEEECPKRKRGGKANLNLIGALFDTAQWALITFNFFGKRKKRSWWGD